MDKMTQQEHIEALKRESEQRKDKASRIQELYETYRTDLRDSAFEELIGQTDAFCTEWVRKHLRNTGCYDDENEHTVLQNARMAVWACIRKDAEQNEIRKNFAYYAYGIYKKKTLDMIRGVSRKRSRADVVSVDAPVGESGRSRVDFLLPVQPDFGERETMRRIYDGVFQVYCTAFLTSKAFPPENLALCYARVLPHLLDAIPESKATSPKWALERMGSQSVWELKQDSETILQKKVSGGLAWGPDFVLQMDEETDVSGAVLLLRDVIYTAAYSRRKIEYWADYMHRKALTTAMRLIPEDRELLELVKEYALDDCVLGRFLDPKEGRGR